MKLKFILFFLLNSIIFSCNNQYNELEDGVYAEINTSLGTMLIQLNYKETPVTVANFIALSKGTHPDVKQDFKEKKFYNGLIFHRVMDKFMIQGGCPLGNGSGNPGYTFDDEINPNLKHDKPGILSMANSGPATNGSQFFITEVPTPWLDGKHTVFGQVISGIEILDKISNVKTAIANRPENDVIINSVNIIKIGESANNFDEVSVWINEEPKLEKRRIEIEKAKREELTKQLEKLSKGYTTTTSGLKYKILVSTKNKKAVNGNNVKVHYTGKLMDGNIFDSSIRRNLPFEFKIGEGRVIRGWEEALQILRVGEKASFIIPSNLAYGPRGAGGVIPPDATLIFEIELLEITN
jgi:cyclophilin family peptidyl-prolyl cis-trans isomerase/nitrogen regulatory protein PII